jgi:hypothetical protein
MSRCAPAATTPSKRTSSPSQDAAEARFTLIAETTLGELPGADGADLQLCQRVQLHVTP